jgi:hypothetical protein
VATHGASASALRWHRAAKGGRRRRRRPVRRKPRDSTAAMATRCEAGQADDRHPGETRTGIGGGCYERIAMRGWQRPAPGLERSHPDGRCSKVGLLSGNPTSLSVCPTPAITRGTDGRDACASKRRDRTNRRVDRHVMRRTAIVRTIRHPAPTRSRRIQCAAHAVARRLSRQTMHATARGA